MRRLWPFLTLAVLTVGLGGGALAAVDLTVLVAVLGGLLIAYGASAGRLAAVDWPRQERWAGPLIGVVNGTLTGMTGSSVPGVMYLQALGLPRAALVQAMGILFTLSTAALAHSLQGQRLINVEVAGLSALALVPAMAGMGFGQAVRRYLSEAHFRRVFFAALLVWAVISRSTPYSVWLEISRAGRAWPAENSPCPRIGHMFVGVETGPDRLFL